MNYPQSEIIRGIVKYVVDEVDIKEYMGEVIDNEIANKINYLNDLKRKIKEAESILE